MIPLTHLPTLLLLIGYPVYWLELYAWPHPTGHTTWLATGLFVLAAAFVIGRQKKINVSIPNFPAWFLWGAGGFAIIIVAVALAASFLPPHLPQEFDTINYHLTMPRQHLIRGSFAHIPWATADLYLSPLDYALAPYWLATFLPNKWPQTLFFVGVLLVAWRLVRKNGASADSGWLVMAAILGCHAFAIQAGTAMLDVVICYCFVAACDSYLEDRYLLAAVELAFCFWAKSFMPFLLAGVLCGVVLLGWLLRGRAGNIFRFSGDRLFPPSRQLVFGFVIVSVMVAGPFIGKSLTCAATPAFPFFAGQVHLLQSPGFVDQAVVDKAKEALETRDGYGLGRNVTTFLEHFFLMAVPTKGVNNPFDYPLGLAYLLFMGPFLWAFAIEFWEKKVSVAMMFVVVYWLCWWFGSQQSRFLLIPLVLVFVIMATRWKKLSRVVLFCVLVALAFEALSIIRAHQEDWGKSAWEVLRPQDRALIEQAKGVKAGEVVVTDKFDMAFAPFAVDVRNSSSVFVIKH